MSGHGRRSAMSLTAALAMMVLGGTPAAVAQEAAVLKAPVPAGITVQVMRGYDDPPPGSTCTIGAEPDHCDNQRYGLDLRLVGRTTARWSRPWRARSRQRTSGAPAAS